MPRDRSQGYGHTLARREFISRLGAAVAVCASPLRGEAAERPVLGILSTSAPDGASRRLPALYDGLKAAGYVEGANLVVETRWAAGAYERLPALAADLVSRRVDLIVTTGGNASARAARAATATIPILFTTGDDPVRAGLVGSLSRPGGNMTGMSLYSTELVEKRLEILHEMAPAVKLVALLVAASPEAQVSTDHAKAAAVALGLDVLVCEAQAGDDFREVLSRAVRQGAQGLLVSAVPSFTVRRTEIISVAARQAWPAVYPWRQFSDSGGLVSFGPSYTEAYYQMGGYAARILKGAAAGELPVQRPTRFELVINLKTAKALGITVPRLLQARADKVIE
jgi:putative tryptophan/tyrosine transport system substrate-binding protein